jgi:predicted phage terminase large subunit-like protein
MSDVAALSQQAIADCRRQLQTDLWALLHVLYPLPDYYWSASVHKPICGFFVQKNPDKSLAAQDVIKQRLYLDPRNHFKTTLDIIDAVQWILCFPSIRILIGSGTRDNAEKMLGAIKSHFKYNETIRYFFPELCPPARKVEDFGTQDAFTCPGRKAKSLREPTCSIASPDSTVAGMHYDVIKFDDLVNETNSRTAEGLKQVNNWYKLTNPLLEPHGYRDVIGTRYDYSDLYGEILGEDFPDDDCVGRYWNNYLVTKRGCYLPDGTPLFAERYTREKLESEQREMGTFLWSAQYLNKPVPSDSQFFPLPLIERSYINRNALPPNRVYFTTLDLAISQASDANRTAIVTCSIGTPPDHAAPRLYVEHLVAGHLKPLETVAKLFEVYQRFRPMQIRTEQVGFSRLMEPILLAEAAKRKQFLPMVWIPRDNKEAKVSRIASLQAWFERGEIHILKDIPYSGDLILELTRFPKYRRDDIVDALADMLALIPMFTGATTAPLVPLSSKTGDARLGLMA